MAVSNGSKSNQRETNTRTPTAPRRVPTGTDNSNDDHTHINNSGSGPGSYNGSSGSRPSSPSYYPNGDPTLNPASYLYASPSAYASTSTSAPSHAYGLGPTLVVLDDPAKKYLQPPPPGSNLPFPPTVPLPTIPSPSYDSTGLEIPPTPLIPTPLPVSLPRLPPIPPLIVHQEQLYFDDGLGAPGKCPHDRKWGDIGMEHREERGLGLTDVEMDDFMVDLGDLVSKEYDAWIERCWVEAFHYTYTVSIPALIIGLIQSGSTTTFLRRNIVYGGPHIDSLLAQQFRHMLSEEHEKRMSDEEGNRRGVDLGNLLAGLVPVAPQNSGGSGGWGSMTGGGAAAGDGSASNRLATGGGDQLEKMEEAPLSATNGRLVSQASRGVGQMPISPNLSYGGGNPPAPPSSTLPSSTPSSNPPQSQPQPQPQSQPPSTTLQYLQHLPDPARTGYGNGVCFHDLALLHGRQGDDHGPCMCDLTACRTCFHELLYFRGRREGFPTLAQQQRAQQQQHHQQQQHQQQQMHHQQQQQQQAHFQQHQHQQNQQHQGQHPQQPYEREYQRGDEEERYVPQGEEEGEEGDEEEGDYEDDEERLRREGEQFVDRDLKFQGQGQGQGPGQGQGHGHGQGQSPSMMGEQQYGNGNHPSQMNGHGHGHDQSNQPPLSQAQGTRQGQSHMKRPSPLHIRHPDMADILLVEEHLRTRLHYMASSDVVLRYGDEDEFVPVVENVGVSNENGSSPPSTDGSKVPEPPVEIKKPQPKPQVKIIPGKRGKGGKMKGQAPPKLIINTENGTATTLNGDGNVNGTPKSLSSTSEEKSLQESMDLEKRLNGSQLPKSWTDEKATTRNMAVILTFRHLVKLLHATALYLSPFDFEEYADDCAVLTEIHPLAVYRRLVEPLVRRRAAVFAQSQADAKARGYIIPENADDPKTLDQVDVKAWKTCMEKWEKEVAIREKEGGNAILKTQPARAVAFYTQAICLDSENPVYYLNRAAAFNAIENYEDAEIDCSRALSLNKSHMKAWYRRAVARKGLGRLDEAEQDLLHLLNQAPNIAAATAELASIRKEIEEMKQREEVDDLD